MKMDPGKVKWMQLDYLGVLIKMLVAGKKTLGYVEGIEINLQLPCRECKHSKTNAVSDLEEVIMNTLHNCYGH